MKFIEYGNNGKFDFPEIVLKYLLSIKLIEGCPIKVRMFLCFKKVRKLSLEILFTFLLAFQHPLPVFDSILPVY